MKKNICTCFYNSRTAVVSQSTEYILPLFTTSFFGVTQTARPHPLRSYRPAPTHSTWRACRLILTDSSSPTHSTWLACRLILTASSSPLVKRRKPIHKCNRDLDPWKWWEICDANQCRLLPERRIWSYRAHPGLHYGGSNRGGQQLDNHW